MRDQKPIIHAEGAFFVGVNRSSSIIHAEGRAGWCSIIRTTGPAEALPSLGDPFEVAAYVLEVLRIGAQNKHFLDHRKEIG